MLYYAVLSGNETIVKTFLKLSHCNEPDSLWVCIVPANNYSVLFGVKIIIPPMVFPHCTHAACL